MVAVRPITAVLSIAAMGATALLMAPPNASAAIGVSVTPMPPKQAAVGWDDSGFTVDYVLVGVKAAPAAPSEYLNKTIGDPDGNVEPGLPTSTTLSDLNVATSYNFRVQLFLVGGGVEEQEVRTQGYRLSLKADRDVVLKGRSVGVQGRLQSSGPKGKGIADATVKIEANPYPFDDNSWSNVATATTREDGTYSATVKPRMITRYRTIYQGEGIGSWTASERVGARVKITISANPNPVDFGRAAVFSGSLRAPDAKVENTDLVLQRRIAGAWTGVAQGKASANGNYSLSFESLNRNDSNYRVIGAAGDYYDASKSKRVKLVVR